MNTYGVIIKNPEGVDWETTFRAIDRKSASIIAETMVNGKISRDEFYNNDGVALEEVPERIIATEDHCHYDDYLNTVL